MTSYVNLLCGMPLGCAGEPDPKSAQHNPADRDSKQVVHDGGCKHWSYHGDNGPQRWGSLRVAYAACRDGKNQSPVDLVGAVPSSLDALRLSYRPVHASVTNNGYTVKLELADAGKLTVADKSYKLLQLHYHCPGEHRVEGKSYLLEIHFVHEATDGSLAVIGLLFEAGESSPALQQIAKHLPEEPGDHSAIESFNPIDLFPNELDYRHYSGSLTTPPCSESVSWLVLMQTQGIGAKELAAFRSRHNGNNRPIQPLNGRRILQSSTAGNQAR